MSTHQNFDAMFSGVIGQDYQLLKLICPFATEMSRLVGETVAAFCRRKDDTVHDTVHVLELGGGTGITTLSILAANQNLQLLSVDNEPAMQSQARQNLQTWAESGKLRFSGDDALTALRAQPGGSFDVLASAYTLHNFQADYRRLVLNEIYRILKPGGWFINGDRYALDDVTAHTRNTQLEVAGYFKVLTDLNRLDLLEHWIIHLFNDESENHIMRETTAIRQMTESGFRQIDIKHRMDVNALLVAVKPLPQ
ncbi:MAG: class I SAM-dependent methyltransferase [Methylococcales bacterium]|nr:class I SAM-dependent methyltransferase [Methylococcales bacterium]